MDAFPSCVIDIETGRENVGLVANYGPRQAAYMPVNLTTEPMAEYYMNESQVFFLTIPRISDAEQFKSDTCMEFKPACFFFPDRGSNRFTNAWKCDREAEYPYKKFH